MTTYQITKGMHYINGRFADGNEESLFDSVNPATGNIVGAFPQASEVEVKAAYDSARGALDGWRSLSRFQRGDYFLRVASLIENNKEDIAEIISIETGKVFNESIAEVNEALHMAQYAFSTGRMPYGEAIASELPEKDAFILGSQKGSLQSLRLLIFLLRLVVFGALLLLLLKGIL